MTDHTTPSPSPARDAGNIEAPGMRLSDRLALSVEETGRLLGISRDLAYDLVARGELPSLRLGRRIVVPRRALVAVLEQLMRTEDRDVNRPGR